MPASGRPPGVPGLPLDLWVAGHLNVDHLLDVGELPARDRTVPARRHRTRLGGTAGNIARSAAGWGVRTGLMACIGDDYPTVFLERLRHEGIDLRGVETRPGAPSPACFIAEDGRGGQSTIIDQGTMGDGVGWRPPETLLNDAGWIHLTTGPPADLLRLKRTARSKGLRIAVDPAQEIRYRWARAPLRELLDGAEILFGNEAELRAIRELVGVPRSADLLRWVGLIVTTRGPRGAVALSRAGTVSVRAEVTRRTVQITGAGDAFRGGFYAGWFNGTPLEGCLRAGVRSARAWIETGGPRPPRVRR